jgi:hypothetical protein
MFRRGRFHDLVERQLHVFATDDADLLEEAAAADAAWTHAGAEETTELYGDYQLVVDAIGERLHDIRETYAATLDDRTSQEYRSAFDKSARRRFGGYVTLLDEEG